MRTKIKIAFALCTCLFFVFIGCGGGEQGANTEKSATNQVARGEYLVTIGSCNYCHSPKLSTLLKDLLSTVPDCCRAIRKVLFCLKLT